MNHLLIDSTFLINELKRKRPPHGIPRVVLAYLDYYSNKLQLVYRVRRKIFILSPHYSQRIAKLLLLWDFKLYKQIVLLLIKGILNQEKVKKGDTYLLLKIDQNGIKYPSYFTQLNQKGIKTFVMIHDLFPITYPEYSDPAYARQFEDNINQCLKNATGLICVSQNTHDILISYVKGKNLIGPPVLAAPLAPGLVSNLSQQPRPVEGPYFVIISTIVARKNHLLLLHLWRKLANELGDKAPKLVIIGKRSPECSSTIAMLDRCQQLRSCVIETTASDQELQNYLTHAAALLFPTFAEGYGLPLIEALSFNVPVIASDLPIFREIAGAIPEYLDPLDGKGWLEMIVDYAKEHSDAREAQLKRVSAFTLPTWQEHFKKVNLFLTHLSPD